MARACSLIKRIPGPLIQAPHSQGLEITHVHWAASPPVANVWPEHVGLCPAEVALRTGVPEQGTEAGNVLLQVFK